MNKPGNMRRYRTLFISDIHMGTKQCQAGMLLEFLDNHEAEKIYLVGDIIDFWRIRKGAHWPQKQNDVIQKFLRKSRKGTEIIYIPGNHDDALREYTASSFGAVDILMNDIHETADGRKYLVLHGDEYDVVMKYAKWVAVLGDNAYHFSMFLNTYYNKIRSLMGLPYWSLSKFLKTKVKKAVNFVGDFEEVLVAEAKRRELDGIICGHIHHAANKDFDGVNYVNTGDWVESCTAVGETFDGELEMIYWIEDRKTVLSEEALNKPANENGVKARKRFVPQLRKSKKAM